MIVSLEWLKDYTEVNVSPEEFCERMIMSGSNLETMEKVAERHFFEFSHSVPALMANRHLMQ